MRKDFIKQWFMALTAVLLLVFFNNYWSEQFLKNAVLDVFKRPLTVSRFFLDFGKKRLTFVFNIGNILRENQTLQAEKRQLVSTRLKMSELEKENEFLRKELRVAKRKNFQVVMASIFHQQFNSQFQTALIDVGANDGLKAGMPAVFDGEILYGLIKEVYADSSLIYLITDPRIFLNVKISESEIAGRSRGSLADGLVLELISNQEEVDPGDLVITSGLDGLPAALAVGRIKTVRVDRGGLFKTIEVEPSFKDLLIDRVFVIK